MREWRLGCIGIKEFVVHACADAYDGSNSLVVAEPTGNRRIRAVTNQAFDKGVRVHQTLHFAWAICPDLIVVEWSETRVEQAINAVLERLLLVTPTAQSLPGYPGCFMVDARGMSLLGGERAFSDRVREICASEGYNEIRIGIASQWTVAFMAMQKATSKSPVFLVSPAAEDTFIRTFMIQDLAYDSTVKEGLSLLGIKTLGQLLALPRAALNERFGTAMAPIFTLLDALEYQTPSNKTKIAAPRVEWVLELAVWTTGHLALGVRHLCVSLSTMLMEIAYHAAQINLCIGLDDRTQCHEIIELVQPTVDSQTFVDLVMARLTNERLSNLAAPVISIVLESDRLTPLEGVQVKLASERWQPHKAEMLLNRLSAKCDQPVVYTATSLESVHESSTYAWLVRANALSPETPSNPEQRVMAQLVRKRLSRSVPISVRTGIDHRPESIFISNDWRTVSVLTRTRASGGWWCDDIYAFEDVNVRLDTGEMYWIRRVPSTGIWLLMGGWD